MTYAELLVLIPQYLNRVNFTELNDQVPWFIESAQRKIQRELRIPPMEVTADFTIGSLTETVPSDLLEVKEFMLLDGSAPRFSFMRQAPMRDVREFVTAGTPSLYTQQGSLFYFGPAPETSFTAELTYYAELPFISATNPTNWFSQYAPELILYASCLEGAIFLHDDNRIQLFSSKYEAIQERIETQAEEVEWRATGRIRNYPLSATGEP